jgi:GT2 family glycosyltransferase
MTTLLPASIPGITVLVCTHNGAALLPPTLAHLAAQQVPPGLAWEVLLVSNASTDNTLALVGQRWAELGSPAPLRLLNEPRPGKPYALERGITEARYDYVCIVDDDNWLAPGYLARATQVLDADSRIGMLGGVGEAVCEVTPPAWFATFARDYAADRQAAQSGDMTAMPGFVYGAGCVLRRAAWARVLAAGFQSLLVQLPGLRSSGEDVEMCYAIALAGFRIWFDEQLHFQHYVPAGRLTWAYLCSLYRSNAGSGVDLRPYLHFQQQQHVPSLVWLRNGAYGLLYAWRFARRAGSVRANTTRPEAAEGNQAILLAAYYRWIAKYFLLKQTRRDAGFRQIAAFVARLRALPS